jgi:hypothetical protein
MYLRHQQLTSVETIPSVKHKYRQLCETLLVVYNVVAISKPNTSALWYLPDLCTDGTQGHHFIWPIQFVTSGRLAYRIIRSKLGHPPTRALSERISESIGCFTSCMQHDADRETRRNFVNWQLQVLRAGQTPHPTCFVFTARFNLDRCVNCQRDTNWHAENPTSTHKIPLHKVKVGVWCAMSATWIMRLIPPSPRDHKFTPKC